jgi:NAD(P)-dependent dehydrogenase (short-subunit alcohol dehydrogenase family)
MIIKVWFVTGAGSGIGVVKAALRAGDQVVATGRTLENVRAAYRDVSQQIRRQAISGRIA